LARMPHLQTFPIGRERRHTETWEPNSPRRHA
jgi:hypothetical protein